MATTNITLNTAKAWVALAFLIITSVLSSNLIPVSGTTHTVLAILAVVLGAIATWATPANPTIESGAVK